MLECMQNILQELQKGSAREIYQLEEFLGVWQLQSSWQQWPADTEDRVIDRLFSPGIRQGYLKEGRASI